MSNEWDYAATEIRSQGFEIGTFFFSYKKVSDEQKSPSWSSSRIPLCLWSCYQSCYPPPAPTPISQRFCANSTTGVSLNMGEGGRWPSWPIWLRWCKTLMLLRFVVSVPRSPLPFERGPVCWRPTTPSLHRQDPKRTRPGAEPPFASIDRQTHTHAHGHSSAELKANRSFFLWTLRNSIDDTEMAIGQRVNAGSTIFDAISEWRVWYWRQRKVNIRLLCLALRQILDK